LHIVCFYLKKPLIRQKTGLLNHYFDYLEGVKSIIIIGGGASGYFTASNINYGNASITILEKSSKILSKVRISGGGRCNVTHNCFDNNILSESYPRGSRELKSVFSRFNVNDCIEWFESKGVRLKTEEDGRMFPVTDDSFSIVNCLINEADKKKVALKYNAEVLDIVRNKSRFEIYLRSDEKVIADYVIVAAGGSPKITGYDFLKTLGIVIIPPVPSLFTFNLPRNKITELMGLSVAAAKVTVLNTKLEEKGPLLITHWGLSGPVVLRLSAWGAKQLSELNYDFKISVSWLGINRAEAESEIHQLAQNKKQLVVNSMLTGIPQRLWKYLVQKAGIGNDIQWANLTNKSKQALVEIIANDIYDVKGKTTFKEEFVTCGGVDLKEVNLSTMESHKHPGLYFTGEVLNVDGITGGFNFQHAWASAFIAAKSITEKELG